MVRPHKHVYDGIIVNHMMKEQIHFSYDKNIGKLGKNPVFRWPIKYYPLTQTPTKLYNAIKNSPYPRISWKTLVKYLAMLVKEHVLIKYPRVRRRYNETHYRLSEYKLYLYLRYLHSLRLESRFLSQTPFGHRPYARLLLTKLYVQVIRILKTRMRPFPPRS
jgi:hypothetical protein